MLVFLSFVISLFRFIGAASDKSMVSNEAPKPIPPAPVQVPVQAAAQTDDTELIAVIAAAIAAAENTTTDSFVVRSIKKVNKTKWRNA